MKYTTLIILNYNNAHDTLACIESILQHNTAPIKIVVVDNASREEEHTNLLNGMQHIFHDDFLHIPDVAEYHSSHLPTAVLADTGENIGYARGNNVGLSLADTDNDVDKVMILNNDILFVEDIIPSLSKDMDNLPDCAIISPVLYKKNLKEYDYNCARNNVKVCSLIRSNLLHYWDLLRNKKSLDLNPKDYLLLNNVQREGALEIQLPSGSCMLIDKCFFKNIGWFDPNTFLYFEENILYKKILALGKKIYISLDKKCIHLGAATTEKTKSNKFLTNVAKRSENYYVQRYSEAAILAKLLHRFSIIFFLSLYNTQKNIQKLFGK